jgi:hypothetical protein
MRRESLLVFICLATLYSKAAWFRVVDGVAEWSYSTPSSDFSEWHECEDAAIVNDILMLPTEVQGHQVAYIFQNALKGLDGVSEVVLPAQLEWIDSKAMIFCKSLKRLVISPTNKKFCSVDGVLYDKCMSRLVAFPQSKDAGVFKIPETVSVISDYAFYNNCLEGMQFGHNIKEVGSAAFMRSRRLKEIRLYGRIEYMGVRVFSRCEELTSVLFDECEFVTGIPDFCFSECQSLSHVVLPESLKYIGSGAFRHCKRIEEMSLPKLEIGVLDDAFEGCIALRWIVVTEKSPKYCSISGVLYDKEHNRVVRCPEAFPGSVELEIPAGVKEIGPGAFAGCRELKLITVPKSVARICKGAFSGCRADIEIFFDGEMPDGLDKSGLPSGCKIYADINLPKWSQFSSKSILMINQHREKRCTRSAPKYP